MKYYKGFYFGGADKETKIIGMTSTKEEPKHISKIVLTDFKDTEGANVTVKLDRENIVEDYRTEGLSHAIPHILDIDIDLAVGQELMILAKNISAGTGSYLQGYIEYEITA